MSGTWGAVVRNVGARKTIVNAELGGHDGGPCTRRALAGMGRKRTEEKGRREDKKTRRSVIKAQMIHGPHVLGRVSSDTRC